MKKNILLRIGITLMMLFLMVPLSSCKESKEEEKKSYAMISQEEAKKLMDSRKDIVILDVRTYEEYAEGHIEGAIQISHEEIEEKAEALLTQKDKTILVYCRSGRRSKIAAEALVNMGYTDVREFGGITDWQYGTVK